MIIGKKTELINPLIILMAFNWFINHSVAKYMYVLTRAMSVSTVHVSVQMLQY